VETIKLAVTLTNLRNVKQFQLLKNLLLISSLLAVAAGVFSVEAVHAATWSPVTGEEKLTKLVSGATAKIEINPDVTATGKYFADGTAKIEAWGETYDRTWRVKGDDQVCYSSFTDTECFTFEQDLENPESYRVKNLDTGSYVYFRVEPGEMRIATGELPDDGAGGLARPSAEDIAAELSNPNTTMGTMNFQFDQISYDGDLPDADDQNATRITFQPALPYPLSDTTNLFVRPAIPMIVQQDVPDGSGDYDTKHGELGDISFDAAIGKSFPNGLVLVGGIVGTLPTATDDDLGLDQWLLGPEFAVALMRPWGVAGVLLTHQWDVAGEDDYDTSITGGQYFYTFNMGGGWQINGSPTFSYNHEARNSDNKLSLPLAVGVSRTVLFSGRPWKFGLQYWHYVESPDDFGPDYQIRFSVSPVVALPW
jgi:hypothetical protein